MTVIKIKIMKKTIFTMLAMATIFLSVNAQKNSNEHHENKHHDKQMKAKNLNLSNTQKEQLKVYHESTKQQLDELKKNDGITVKEYNARKAAIREKQKEQMINLLTPEQKNELAQHKNHKEGKELDHENNKLDKMKSRLNLTDDQMVRIKATRNVNEAKIEAIKENSQLSNSTKKEQIKAIKQTEKDTYKQILTSEQLNKMEEKRKDHNDNPPRK